MINVNIKRTLHDSWFSPDAPVFDLAVVRILVGVFVSFNLLAFKMSGVAFAVGKPDESWDPIWVMRILNLGLSRPDEIVVYVFFWIATLGAIGLLVGLLTNLSAFMAGIGHLYITGYAYSFGHVHHPEAVMIFALFALALSPCGKILSLDYLLWWRKSLPNGQVIVDIVDHRAGWPLKLIMFFFVLMYLSAVQSKILREGEWLNGITLQWYLVKDGILWDSPLAVWLSTQHYLIYALQYLVYFLQSTFLIAVLFPKTRWFYVPVGLCFHLAIYFLLKAPFFYWWALYAVFIPWRRIVVRLTTPIAQPGQIERRLAQ